MNFKTIIFLLIIILLTFLIYLTTIDKKVYYLDLSLNNFNYNTKTYEYLNKKNKLEKFVTGFVNNDYRTTDLIRDIVDNKKIKKQTIKNALIKADLLTLSIGFNDINYKISSINKIDLYKYGDEVIKDIEKLLKLSREYCKEDIIFIGIPNLYGMEYDEFLIYINNKIQKICEEYNINFINPLTLQNQYNYQILEEHQNKIYNEIKNIIDNKILN